MRIVSPWQDYYDCGMKHGANAGAVFVRKTEHHTDSQLGLHAEYTFLRAGLPRARSINLKDGGSIELEPFRIAFCGKIFNAMRVHVVLQRGPDVLRHAYTLGDLIDIVSDYKLAKPHHEADLLKKGHGVWSDKLESFLSAPVDTAHEADFSAQAHAVVLARPAATQLNPALKSLDFFRVRDPMQAYQELEMFFDGRAAPENKPPVEIEDKHRISQHGFDKQSFRKAPTKRR